MSTALYCKMSTALYCTQMKNAAVIFICNADLSFCGRHSLPIPTGSFLVVSRQKLDCNLDSEKKGRTQRKLSSVNPFSSLKEEKRVDFQSFVKANKQTLLILQSETRWTSDAHRKGSDFVIIPDL